MKRLLTLITLSALVSFGIMAQRAKVETLIIGTYTPSHELKDPQTKSAYIVTFDAEKGTLQLIDSIHAGINASFIAANHRQKRFYAVNELGGQTSQGILKSFRYTIPWTQAVETSSCSTMGNDPCHVSIDPKNNMITAANYSSGNIISIKTNKKGDTECHQKINNQHTSEAETTRPRTPHAHQTVTAPFGNFVYACDLGMDAIYVYRIGHRPFSVNRVHTIKTEPGAGPRHMLFHPNQKFAYVANELNGTVECYSVNKKTGNLTRIQTVPTTTDEFKSKAASADIHITTDGKYLYTSNRGIFNEIICFEADPITGLLRIIGRYPSGGKGPRNFRIANNNRYLLVANQRSNNVVVFEIDSKDGALIETGNRLNIHAPVCITEL